MSGFSFDDKAIYHKNKVTHCIPDYVSGFSVDSDSELSYSDYSE